MIDREKSLEKYLRELIANAEVVLEDVVKSDIDVEDVSDILDEFEKMEILIRLASAKLVSEYQSEDKHDRIWSIVENKK